MEKKSDIRFDIPSDFDIPESEDSLVLPKEERSYDGSSQFNDTNVFKTEEILTIIENRVNEEPKRRKRNRVRDVFKKLK
jgi:hypothetical protein